MKLPGSAVALNIADKFADLNAVTITSITTVITPTSSATAPVLNDEFIKCVPRKDVFAAPSEPAMIISFGNLLKAIRPIPVQSEPGLIDHV